MIFKLFQSPNQNQVTLSHKVRIIKFVLFFCISIAVVFVGIGIANDDIFFEAFAVILLSLLGWWLVSLGAVNSVGLAIPFILLIVITYRLGVANGVRDTLMSAYIVIILFCALLLGKRVTAFFVVACIGSVAWLVQQELTGVIVPKVIGATDFTDLFSISAFFIVAALLSSLIIDDLNKALIQLQESETRYRSLVETIPDGFYRSTSQGKYVDLNEGMVKILGYESKEELMKTSIPAQLFPFSDDRFQKQSKNHESMYKTETYQLERKDGTLIWLEDHHRTLVDEKVKILYREGVCRDISKRKQTEDEREKLIKELEATNTELTQFTYTVSHDLKSPLITINGYLGYIEQDAESGNIDRLKKDTQRIKEAVGKMHALLTELLELSRIGRLMNEPAIFPFEKLIEDAVKIVHGQLKKHKITVQTQPDLPSVYGDRQRLTEVLQNLLDNAAKYMGNQPDPRIEIGQSGEEDGTPIFFVKDNGIGIAPEYHERIFGLFNKLDAQSEGTGVGLSLVKRIIEFHGGRIWVESEVGKGATFYFTLPQASISHHQVNL